MLGWYILIYLSHTPDDFLLFHNSMLLYIDVDTWRKHIQSMIARASCAICHIRHMPGFSSFHMLLYFPSFSHDKYILIFSFLHTLWWCLFHLFMLAFSFQRYFLSSSFSPYYWDSIYEMFSVHYYSLAVMRYEEIHDMDRYRVLSMSWERWGYSFIMLSHSFIDIHDACFFACCRAPLFTMAD